MYRPATRPQLPISLRRLFPSASFVGCADVAARDASESSRDCTPGCTFAALPGTRTHGRQFVSEALSRGATALLTDRPLAEFRVPQCIVADPRRAYAELCHALFGFPTRRLGVVGVTGTNGKTTTTWLVRSILESAGQTAGLLGTIECSDGLERTPSQLTTPDSATLARWLAQMVARCTRYAALELSSHALDQGRAAGTLLDVAVVTNVTHDHFDYHGDHHAYLAAKAKILDQLKPGGLVVLNADDPGASSLMQRIPPAVQLCTFGLNSPADVSARVIESSTAGTRFLLRVGVEQLEVGTPLIGQHNVQNCLAAVAAVTHFGVSLDEIAVGLESLPAVPGRLEPVRCGQPFSVFVDYAHTEDALERAIAAVRDVTVGRVYCVFGCGGDRDRAKRPLMGRTSAEADVAVVTSDNPRSEDPSEIIDQIRGGIPPGTAAMLEPDRERAISWALQAALPGDSVLIAGKGHETTQTIGQSVHPFDDRAVAARLLQQHAPKFHHHANFLPVTR